MFTLNDPYALRINKELAMEIGFNESIVLLQFEYLIGISNNWRDGWKWTYQSLTDLQKEFFPWWSRDTINRTIQNLVGKGLLIVGNYNRHRYDRTRWFRLDEDGCDALQSITMRQVG